MAFVDNNELIIADFRMYIFMIFQCIVSYENMQLHILNESQLKLHKSQQLSDDKWITDE